MKQKLIIAAVIVVVALAIYFYTKGKKANISLNNAGTGNAALDAEDNAFTQKLWDKFTSLVGEKPNWVMESAIKTHNGEGDHHLGLDGFYKHKGVLLKSGALFATIQAGYQPLGKMTAEQWQTLWDMYTNWHTQLNLKY